MLLSKSPRWCHSISSSPHTIYLFTSAAVQLVTRGCGHDCTASSLCGRLYRAVTSKRFTQHQENKHQRSTFWAWIQLWWTPGWLTFQSAFAVLCISRDMITLWMNVCSWASFPWFEIWEAQRPCWVCPADTLSANQTLLCIFSVAPKDF